MDFYHHMTYQNMLAERAADRPLAEHRRAWADGLRSRRSRVNGPRTEVVQGQAVQRAVAEF